MKKLLVLLVFLFTMLSTYDIVAQEKWQLQNSNFPANVTVTNFSPVNDLVCWAGGEILGSTSAYPYPGYIRTTDGGNTWVCDSIPGIPDGCISQVFAIDANTAYVAVYVISASNSKGIFKTTDGGNSWTKQNAYSTALNGPGNIYFFDANNGVVIGDPFLETYTTTNGGQTWNRVSMQALSGEYTWVGGSVITGHGNSVWFHTTHRMFRSTDRGNTWTAFPDDSQYYLWLPCIAFQDENTGIYSLWEFGDTSKIYRKTTNGGATWTDFSNSVLNNITPTSIIHIPGTTASYIVSDGTHSPPRGSALTHDAGENWIPLDTDNFGCWEIRFTNDSSGWGSSHQTNQVYKYIGPPYPVPVELTSFTATSNGKEVILNWSTATEINNQGFDIEKSEDNTNFNKIGFVPGFGTTTEPKCYSYSDQSVNSGTNYYRLKQVDFDGSYEYSDVVEVDFKAFNSYVLEQCYPNPFNPTTTIGFGLQNKSIVKITILNAIGEEVAVVLNEEREAGFHQVEFNAANLPSGVYFYQLKAGEFIETKKMLLLK
jgi:photosystem II stability/assembly factor-like uncharacterized protein